MKYMLDTNICIFAIRNKSDKVIRRINASVPSELCISAVTYAELMHGVEKSSDKERNRLALLLMLANFTIVDFDTKAACEYGAIRAELEKKGTPIGVLDMMIAGHARSLGLTLVTNNTKEFTRVSELAVEDWT